MDKLLHLTCVADLAQAGSEKCDDNSLLTSLDQIKKNESVLLPDKQFGLRTRRPRRVTNIENKNGAYGANSKKVVSGPYQVRFGGVGRSRIPSKKNVVLETCDTHNEWNDDEEFPPFQLGKIDEDHFSLDFSHLSPIQAFSIALAVFNES